MGKHAGARVRAVAKALLARRRQVAAACDGEPLPLPRDVEWGLRRAFARAGWGEWPTREVRDGCTVIRLAPAAADSEGGA